MKDSWEGRGWAGFNDLHPGISMLCALRDKQQGDEGCRVSATTSFSARKTVIGSQALRLIDPSIVPPSAWGRATYPNKSIIDGMPCAMFKNGSWFTSARDRYWRNLLVAMSFRRTNSVHGPSLLTLDSLNRFRVMWVQPRRLHRTKLQYA